MVAVERHIGILLQTNDCVIVPGFGGFVSNTISSRFKPAQNSLFPPSKNILFNKQLLVNDGLLAGHIAQVSGMSYTDAITLIDQFVKDCKDSLKQGNRLEWTDIGILFYDEQENIKFVQDLNFNYLKGSYGLGSIKLTAINKGPAIKEIVFEDRKAATDNTIATPVKKWNYVRIAAAAVAIPLAGLLIWMSFSDKISGNASFSNLNPFSGNVSLYSAIDFSSVEPLEEEKVASVKDSNGIYELRISNAISKAIIVSTGKRDSTLVKPVLITRVNEKKNFHIIAGCFSSLTNAERLVSELKAKGFNATLAGMSNAGLYRVSLNSYSNHREATIAMTNLKKDFGSLWLSEQK